MYFHQFVCTSACIERGQTRCTLRMLLHVLEELDAAVVSTPNAVFIVTNQPSYGIVCEVYVLLSHGMPGI